MIKLQVAMVTIREVGIILILGITTKEAGVAIKAVAAAAMEVVAMAVGVGVTKILVAITNRVTVEAQLGISSTVTIAPSPTT